MIKFYKIWLFWLIYIALFWASIVSASSIDAWSDDTRWWWDYNLNWSYEWLTWCWFMAIGWWSELHIENADNLTTAYIPEDILSPATGWNYIVELKIDTDSMCDDVAESYTQFVDTMTLCVPNDWFVCWSSPSTWASSWGGSSRSSRMRSDAKRIFATTWSIDAIDIHLTKRITFPNTLFSLNRNYIWWDWAIKYEIEYSTWSNFYSTWKLDIYRSQIARRRSYNIYINNLSQDSIIHYFRVRAFYKNKYSNRSNTVDYINEDNPLSEFVVECKDCKPKTSCVGFADVLLNPEVLIEGQLNIACNYHLVDFTDAFINNNILCPDASNPTKEICDGLDNNCNWIIDELDEIEKYYMDADLDWYGDPDREITSICQKRYAVTNNLDCDDDLDYYNPWASELDCSDTEDYNCDGSLWYDDKDWDWFVACKECNDSNSNIYPGADELCDGLDNDCDGIIDEDPTNGSNWYADVDQDWYGDFDQSILACSEPLGYVFDHTDCDDFNRLIFPTAVGQECLDRIDYNCDDWISCLY